MPAEVTIMLTAHEAELFELRSRLHAQNRLLQTIHHGHDFNTATQRCRCGISASEYFAMPPSALKDVCPM